MTRDDINRLAREAGLHELRSLDERYRPWVHLLDIGAAEVQRFVALNRAAERDACAAILEENAMHCENPIMRSLLQANAAELRARGN